MATLYRLDWDFVNGTVDSSYYYPVQAPVYADTVLYRRNFGLSSLLYSSTSFPSVSSYPVSGWYCSASSSILMYGGPSSTTALTANNNYTFNSEVGTANGYANGTAALDLAPFQDENSSITSFFLENIVSPLGDSQSSNLGTWIKTGSGIVNFRNLTLGSGKSTIEIREGLGFFSPTSNQTYSNALNGITVGTTTKAATSFASAPSFGTNSAGSTWPTVTINNTANYITDLASAGSSLTATLTDKSFLRILRTESSNTHTFAATLTGNATLAVSGFYSNGISFNLSASGGNRTVTLAGYQSFYDFRQPLAGTQPYGTILSAGANLRARVVGAYWETKHPFATPTNVWDPSFPLTLGNSGRMRFTSADVLASSQTFNGLVLENDSFSYLSISRVSSSTYYVHLGSITRNNTRSAILFSNLSWLSGSSVLGISTTASNTNNILGGWALFQYRTPIAGAEQHTWAAAIDNGSGTYFIGPVASTYSTTTGGNTVANYTNLNVIAQDTFPTFSSSGWNPNSLIFTNTTAGGDSTITLTGSNTIQSGGIILQPGTTVAVPVLNSLTGGSLTSGTETLYVHSVYAYNYPRNTRENFAINTTLTDNGNPVSVVFTGTYTKAFENNVLVTGVNTYSGETIISGSFVHITNSSALGTNVNVALKENQGDSIIYEVANKSGLVIAMDGISTNKKFTVDSYTASPLLMFRRSTPRNLNFLGTSAYPFLTDLPSSFSIQPRNFNYASSDLTIGREMQVPTTAVASGNGVDPSPVGLQIGLYGRLKLQNTQSANALETTYPTGSNVTYRPNKIRMLGNSYFQLFGDYGSTFTFRPGYIQAANASSIHTPLTFFLGGNATLVLDQAVEAETLSLYGKTSLYSVTGFGNSVYLQKSAALKSQLNVAGLSLYVQNNNFGTSANPMTTVRLAQNGTIDFAPNVSTGLDQTIYFSLGAFTLLQTNNGTNTANTQSYILANNNTTFGAWGASSNTSSALSAYYYYQRAQIRGKIVLSKGSYSPWSGDRTLFGSYGEQILSVPAVIAEDSTGSYSPVVYNQGGLSVFSGANTYSGNPWLVTGNPLNSTQSVSFWGPLAFGVGTKTLNLNANTSGTHYRVFSVNNVAHNFAFAGNNATTIRNVFLRQGNTANILNTFYNLPQWTSNYTFSGSITQSGASTAYLNLVGSNATVTGPITVGYASGGSSSCYFTLVPVYAIRPVLTLAGNISLTQANATLTLSSSPSTALYTTDTTVLNRFMSTVILSSPIISIINNATCYIQVDGCRLQLGRDISNLHLVTSGVNLSVIDLNGYQLSTYGAWSTSSSFDYILLRGGLWRFLTPLGVSTFGIPARGFIEGMNGTIAYNLADNATTSATYALFKDLTIRHDTPANRIQLNGASWQNVTFTDAILNQTGDNFSLSIQGSCSINNYRLAKTGTSWVAITTEGSAYHNNGQSGILTITNFDSSFTTSTNNFLQVRPLTTTSAPINITNATFHATAVLNIIMNARQLRDIDTNGATVDYPLIRFSSPPTLSKFAFANGTTTNNPTSTSITKTLKVVGNDLVAAVNVDRLVWKGTAVSNTWNTSTTIWRLQSAGAGAGATAFANGTCVLFDDTGHNTVVTSGTLSPALINFNNSINYTITGASSSPATAASSLGAIVKKGSGEVYWNVPTAPTNLSTIATSADALGYGLYINQGRFIVNAGNSLPNSYIYVAPGATFGVRLLTFTSVSTLNTTANTFVGVGGTYEVDCLTTSSSAGTVFFGEISPQPVSLFSATLALKNTNYSLNPSVICYNFVPPKNMCNFPGAIDVATGISLFIPDGSYYFPNDLTLRASGCPISVSSNTLNASTGLSYLGQGALCVAQDTSGSGTAVVSGNITLSAHTKISSKFSVSTSSTSILTLLGADVGYIGKNSWTTSDFPRMARIEGVISGAFNLILASIDGISSSVIRLTNTNTYSGTTWLGDTTGTSGSYFSVLIVGDGATNGRLGSGAVTLNASGYTARPILMFHRTDTYTLAQNITTAQISSFSHVPSVWSEAFDVRTAGYQLNLTASSRGGRIQIGGTFFFQNQTRALTINGGTAAVASTLNMMYTADQFSYSVYNWGNSPSSGVAIAPSGTSTLNIIENSSLTLAFGSPSTLNFGYSGLSGTTFVGAVGIPNDCTINVAAGSSLTAILTATRGCGTLTLNNAGTTQLGSIYANHYGTLYLNQTAGSLLLAGADYNYSSGAIVYNLSGGAIGNTGVSTNDCYIQFTSMNITNTVDVNPAAGTIYFNYRSSGYPSAVAGITGGTLNFVVGASPRPVYLNARALAPDSNVYQPSDYSNSLIISSNLTGAAGALSDMYLGTNGATYVFNGTNTVVCNLRPSAERVRVIVNGSWSGGSVNTSIGNSLFIVGGTGTISTLWLNLSAGMLEVDGAKASSLTVTNDANIASNTYVTVYNVKNTGTQRILNYGTTTASSFLLVGSSNFRSPSINVSGGQIDLSYTVYNLTWAGTASNEWKVGGSAANFSGSDTVQRAGDNVLFDDTSNAGSRNIKLVAGELEYLSTWNQWVAFNYTNAGNITFNNTVAYSIYTEDSTAIAGPSSFTKNGSGTLTLTESLQNNYFTGGFNLNAGTVVSQFRTTLGAGDLNLAGGTLQVSDALSLNGTVLYLTGNFNWSGGTLSVQ